MICTRTSTEAQLINAVGGSDAVITAGAGYHDGVSALLTNALDLLGELAR